MDQIPTVEEMTALIGAPLYDLWADLCALIDTRYDMERLWNRGGKKWTYEYKYRRGGKTLCALYMRENCIGFMAIFGKEEREKFEGDRDSFSEQVRALYDEATTYHDGKWLMLYPTDRSLFGDIERLLAIKRKPNKKTK
ncbi:MAG: DUF3788 domain-containing protein [Oscillospiraceae bacterium]|nr:DUF3788 domain-containing protein [Oscillospiraceae bacterium]